MLKRIFINLVLIFLLLFFLEFLCFIIAKRDNTAFKLSSDKLEGNKTRDFVTKYRLFKDFNPSLSRKSHIIENSTKKPVILFGCSFAEGAGLDDENTPCSKIAKLTKRSCINKSKGATGTQFIYYQLKDDNFYKENPNAEYIIYVFIHNHITRLYNYRLSPLIYMFNLRYKLKHGKLHEIKPFFRPIYSSFFIQKFLDLNVILQAQQEEKNYELFNEIMKESVTIAREHYPDVNIILLEYPDETGHLLPDKEVEKLENMGINVVKVTDLTKNIDIWDKKYWLEDNIHPNNAAWDYILPRLTQKYIH